MKLAAIQGQIAADQAQLEWIAEEVIRLRIRAKELRGRRKRFQQLEKAKLSRFKK